MRYSKDHKAETHERIVKSASVRLREGGAASIGVADLMKETGLTHGGFYAHFASRDALIEEAFAHAMDLTAKRWRKRAEAAPVGKELAAIVTGYLTTQHRDDVGNGCALPSLGAEVVRAGPRTRKAVAAKIEEMIETVSESMPSQTAKAARREAMGALATMMGTLVLARMAGTGDLSEDILAAGRQFILDSEASAKTRAKKHKSLTSRA